MKKIKVYALLVCLLATSAAQAQSFGSAAMRKLQMAEFAISNFYVDKVDEDKLEEEAIRNLIFICMKQQCILRMERLGGLLLHSLKNINLSYRS